MQANGIAGDNSREISDLHGSYGDGVGQLSVTSSSRIVLGAVIAQSDNTTTGMAIAQAKASHGRSSSNRTVRETLTGPYLKRTSGINRKVLMLRSRSILVTYVHKLMSLDVKS